MRTPDEIQEAFDACLPYCDDQFEFSQMAMAAVSVLGWVECRTDETSVAFGDLIVRLKALESLKKGMGL